MRKLKFDKKTFNWGYAYVYTLLQRIFVVGFIIAVSIVVFGATTDGTVELPDIVRFVLLLIAPYWFVSFVGFPLVSVTKLGYKRLIVRSTVTYDGETLKYNKLALFHWTIVGHVEEYHTYTVSKIDSVTETKFSYIVKGSIKKVVINNGRKLESKKVDKVKIPKAYADMDALFNAIA